MEDDVSLNNDIFNKNDIIYGISTQSSNSEDTLTKSEMSAFAKAFNESLREDNINVSNGYGRGVKSKAAKIAAKQMLKKLKHIGAKAFEKAIRKAAKKLPKAAAEKVEKYLTYQKVSTVLNIAANVEGTITDAVQHALQKVGIPKTFAVIGARLIVFVLF